MYYSHTNYIFYSLGYSFYEYQYINPISYTSDSKKMFQLLRYISYMPLIANKT